MKAGELKVTFDGMKKFQEAMKVLAITDVYVGIPQEAADKREKTEDEEYMNNATIGYIQENGSNPVTPFIQQCREKYAEDLTFQVNFPIFLKAGKIER